MSSNKSDDKKSEKRDLQNDDPPAMLKRQNAFIYEIPKELQSENSVKTDKEQDKSEVTTDKKLKKKCSGQK